MLASFASVGLKLVIRTTEGPSPWMASQAAFASSMPEITDPEIISASN